VVELVATPADEPWQRDDDDGIGGGDEASRVCRHGAVHEHPVGSDQRSSLVIVVGKVPADQLRTETPARPHPQELGVAGVAAAVALFAAVFVAELVFLAADFVAEDVFLAGLLRAVDFFVADLVAELAFLAAVLVAVAAFLAGLLRAVDLFVADFVAELAFLAALFVAVAAFLAVDFLAADFVAVDLAGVDVRAPAMPPAERVEVVALADDDRAMDCRRSTTSSSRSSRSSKRSAIQPICLANSFCVFAASWAVVALPRSTNCCTTLSASLRRTSPAFTRFFTAVSAC